MATPIHHRGGSPLGVPLPYRGTFGDPRPLELTELALPPAAMPARQGSRPLKAWRYVGFYGPDVMLCAASVRVGPARQAFWAVWDRRRQRLYERTTLGQGAVRLGPGRLAVSDGSIRIELALEEQPGIETVCRSGESYGWTRKQGGIAARGQVSIDGDELLLDGGRAVIDDTAAYYQRHTSWLWSAGVGTASDGRPVAWNLVEGVNDPERGSERTIWIGGVAEEPPPQTFAPDLSSVGALRFTSEAVRERNENRLLIRSHYRQPFGTFGGALPDGTPLAEGFGVMEDHDVYW